MDASRAGHGSKATSTWPMQMVSTRDMRGSARGMLIAGAAKRSILLTSLRRQGQEPTSEELGSLVFLSSVSCSKGKTSSGRRLTDSPAHTATLACGQVKATGPLYSCILLIRCPAKVLKRLAGEKIRHNVTIFYCCHNNTCVISTASLVAKPWGLRFDKRVPKPETPVIL